MTNRIDIGIALTECTNNSALDKTCAHPGLASEGLVLGSVVAGYVVEAIRGYGGFATVYRARSQASSEVVALKVLYPHLTAAGSGPLLRFEREIETITRLRHRNIVNVLASGEISPGRPFYVMEWLEGTSVDEELRNQGPFSTAEAIALLDDLSSALAAAHDLGIVHRDIKASNVMLVPSSGGRIVKLLDFGIAKLLDKEGTPSDGLTSSGSMIGTPHYMAPEQICGLAVGPRTDIYSLGVLLFELVTGTLPFTAETTLAIADMHLHSPPPKARDIAPVSPRVDEIIERCLQKKPVDRFASVTELRLAMQDALRSSRESQARARSSPGDHPSTVTARRRAQGTSVPALVARLEVSIIDEPQELQDELGDTVLAAGSIDEALPYDDDRMLDDLENVMAIARRELAAANLVIVTATGNMIVGTAALPVEDSATARAEILDQLRAICERIAKRSDRHPQVVPTMIASLGRVASDETGYEGERPAASNCLLVTRSAIVDIASRVGATELAGSELFGVPLGTN